MKSGIRDWGVEVNMTKSTDRNTCHSNQGRIHRWPNSGISSSGGFCQRSGSALSGNQVPYRGTTVTLLKRSKNECFCCTTSRKQSSDSAGHSRLLSDLTTTASLLADTVRCHVDVLNAFSLSPDCGFVVVSCGPVSHSPTNQKQRVCPNPEVGHSFLFVPFLQCLFVG